MYEWNQTEATFADDQCLHELIANFARSQPDLLAVNDGEQQLTYAQLDDQANQLAHYLRQEGLTAVSPVGICMDRSVQMIVAVLAVLKAGGAYVPIDPTLPAQRLDFIVRDAQLPFVLVQQQIAGLGDKQLVCWEEDGHALFTDMPTTSLDLPSEVTQPAYMIYTSGSTGQPKGVLCHHRGVLNLLAEFNGRSPLPAQTNHSLWTNITFDVSVYEIFSALTTGGTLHIVPAELRARTNDVLQWLQQKEISSTYLPPFMLADMAEWLEQPTHSLNLERLLVGVEPILETTLARIQAEIPNVKILNGYGPTEATVCVTLEEFSTKTPQAKPLPIGRPMQNTQIYLLNNRMQPVPIGVAGELYIGGVGLAHGYWQRPDLTERAFLPNPFIASERIYKTGDLARYLPDGRIEFLGRADFQVKVRGYRVELGEIETAVLQHPSVKQTVITTDKDSIGNRYIIAYIVPHADGAIDDAELRQFLLTKLPDYMVPSIFIPLAALPLTRSDKVDRKALPAPAASWSTNSFVAPQTPIEELVAATFTAVLQVENVGRNSSFLQLGGHSLLATQLVSRLNNALNVEIPLSLVFTHPKLCDFAQAIEQLQTDETTIPKLSWLQADKTQPLPLSFAQQRLWFLQQLEPQDTSYNIPLALQLDGHLDTAVLEKSLNEIVRRHDSLRTIFPHTESEPIQTVLPYAPFTLNVVDLTSEADVETAVSQHTTREAQTPFDLTQSALRISLLRLEQTTHLLLFTTHHIISDGWSHAVFAQELSTLYQAFLENQPSPLPELTHQYADYALSQRQWLQGDVLNNLSDYWRNKLEATPAQLELPTDFSRPRVQTHNGGQLSMPLSPTLSQSLRVLCQDEGTTLFMGMLATFKLLLHRLSQQNDIVVGAPIANRNQLATEQMIGFFINTLVLRTQLDPSLSFTELLTAVRETTLDAYAHQDLPFEKLVELLQPERNLSQTPFFQVFFNMVNVPEAKTQLADVKMTQRPWVDVSAKFDLTLYVSETTDQINLELVYNSDLFTAERMSIWLAQYVGLLTQICTSPSAPLSTFTLQTDVTSLPDPTQPLLPKWETAVHNQLTVHAQTQPNQIAVQDENRSLTYAQLEVESNQLAHFLQDKQIGKGDVVAIYAARTVDLVTAVTAVHKAGAAFLILDPAYPAQRLLNMMQQAKPKAWIAIAETGSLPTSWQEYLQQNIDCQLRLPSEQLAIISNPSTRSEC